MTEATGGRLLAWNPSLNDTHTSECPERGGVVHFDWPEGIEPNLVTSCIPGPRNMHALSLDIDMPVEVVPSKTEGHYHLYLTPKVQIPWAKYCDLLEMLAELGIIERGYCEASKARGATMLRVQKTEGLVMPEAA